MDIKDLEKHLTWKVDEDGGEYIGYPVRITYYYKGKRAWEDDYPEEISDKQKLHQFQHAVSEGYAEVELGD